MNSRGFSDGFALIPPSYPISLEMRDQIAARPSATMARMKSRWFRFSLRTLLLLIAALCVWLGIQVNAAQRQKRAVDALQQGGVGIFFDYYWEIDANDPEISILKHNPVQPGPAWLRKLIGDEYFREVVGVSLNNQCSITESEFSQVAKLPKINSVALHEAKITSNGTGITRPVKDSDFVVLENLNQLRDLYLTGADVEDIGLAALLKSARSLKNLTIIDSPINDAGMGQIGKLTELKHLTLQNIRITDSGLSHLRNLSKLDSLQLFEVDISDAGIKYLKELKNVGVIWIRGTRITLQGYRELQTALPTTIIYGTFSG